MYRVTSMSWPWPLLYFFSTDVLAVLLALALVVLNGVFVAAEFAFVKVRPTRIEELLRKHRPGASSTQHIIAHIDAYLSAIQLGITFASLGLGWVGEPAFAKLLVEPLRIVGLSDPEWIHRIALVSAFALITFLHLVVGELAPKTLALVRTETVALAAAYPIRLFYTVFYPLTWLLNSVANRLVRWAGITPGKHSEGIHSEEEIKMIVGQARSAGLLSGPRSELMRRALSLPTKTARHLMVPRNEAVFLDINAPLEENIARAMESGHTRFPLCDRELDDVLGIVEIRNILYQLNSGVVDLKLLATPPAYFPEAMSGERLLSEFRARRVPMAIVVDEYGGASGIITPADVVTAVMGELEEAAETEVVTLPGGVYEVEGITTIEEIEAALKIVLNAHGMRTVAGFLMERLGRMPRANDRVIHEGFSFQVLEVAGPKVGRVRVQRDTARAERLGNPSVPPKELPTKR